MTFKIGDPMYSDFGLRADELIAELQKAPPGAVVCVEIDDKCLVVEDVDKEWGDPLPEWYQLKDEEAVPLAVVLHCGTKDFPVIRIKPLQD